MSGTASSSSRAAVPWPACTRGSSKGWISTAPVSATSAATVAARASRVGSQITTSAPAASVAARLVVGTPRGHHDRAADAPLLRGARQRGGVVARRVRHHSPRGLLVGQEEHRVGGAPQLEGAGGVQVLRLQVHPRAHPLVDPRRSQHRRRRHQVRDPQGCRPHVVKRRRLTRPRRPRHAHPHRNSGAKGAETTHFAPEFEGFELGCESRRNDVLRTRVRRAGAVGVTRGWRSWWSGR